jgi:predicted nucleic acid-binding protein
MGVLVDTSIWIDHLRSGNDRLAELLHDARVVSHPFVIGEIACGSLINRSEILALLQALPSAPEVSNAEALLFLQTHELMGRGIGWVDVHLLASARLSGVSLWTGDRRLRVGAESVGVSGQ